MHAPWVEFIGTIEDVGEDYVTLRVAYTIYISKEEVKKWISKLRKGSRVGILLLDNSRVCVRVLGEAGGEG